MTHGSWNRPSRGRVTDNFNRSPSNCHCQSNAGNFIGFPGFNTKNYNNNFFGHENPFNWVDRQSNNHNHNHNHHHNHNHNHHHNHQSDPVVYYRQPEKQSSAKHKALCKALHC
ncbi:hypothetical protein LBA_00566 [Megavirus lba]|uniref:Uncharacterized protein n=1 Tax=Megavirus lba TaxID=1235314 RepID=L7Y3W3_9VIRU|nr:hypothetical protein LBA_00566 [Megavirus lba]